MSASKIISSQIPANGCIIFLHGLGDTSLGWSWLADRLKQPNGLKNADRINYVFPNAPMSFVSGIQTMSTSWFDFESIEDIESSYRSEDVFKSSQILKDLIKEQIEKYKVPSEKIIIGGFSQGSVISLVTYATLDVKIGGLISLSGFLPLTDSLRKLSTSVNRDSPFLIGHGKEDDIILPKYADETLNTLYSLGFKNGNFHKYESLGHGISLDELEEVVRFTKAILE